MLSNPTRGNAKKAQSFQSNLERILSFALLTSALTSTLVVSAIFSYYISQILGASNAHKVEHSIDVFERKLHEVVSDLTSVATDPVIVNGLISPDNNKMMAIFAALRERTDAAQVALFDNSGKPIYRYPSTDATLAPIQLTATEVYRLTSAGNPIMRAQSNILFTMPISYYSTVEGILALEIHPITYVRNHMSAEDHFELQTLSGEMLYSNHNEGDYLLGTETMSHGIASEHHKLQLTQYATQNPYYAIFLQILVGVWFLFSGLAIISIMIARKFSRRLVNPIHRLVEVVSNSNTDEHVRCHPLGADDEFE
ncbi:MAG: hypothetical protein OXT67_05900, partial [Zetaproteobacteria bacterium]|nr:hypothetical protein [Zetaproteobacteria bacterium]